ncbi:MAG: hypothetical protein AAGD25_34555 [Cyanobacteria bacterium P01_F01_bin.150]
MANQPNESFIDNWAYLKTELGWLDRMLMMALSRYRQDKKEVDRVAQSKADKASSHWWKGVISLDGKTAYDEHRPNAKINTDRIINGDPKSPNKAGKSNKITISAKKTGYQQQLDARLTASRNKGIIIALPWFRDRLKLSLFEKNLVIMALAPEVNRRYARLYRYLQSQDDNHLVSDLPTVELVLRLLCRNDVEWRRARTSFHPDAPLMRHGLLMILNDSHDPFLNATLRLSDDFVDHLLAETPKPNLMEQLLASTTSPPEHHPSNQYSDQLPSPFPIEFSQEFSVSPSSNGFQGEAGLNVNNSLIGSDENGISPEKEVSDGSMVQSHVGKNVAQDSTLSAKTAGQAMTTSAENGRSSPGAPTWTDLVVAPELKALLQHLSHRLTLHKAIQEQWDSTQLANKAVNRSANRGIHPGLITIFAGASGTGKRLAAQILANDLATTVHYVDLADVMDFDYFQLLDELESLSPSVAPSVVMIHSADRWLSRTATLPDSRLNQFLTHRRKRLGLTIFSLERGESVAQVWQQQVDQSMLFALPTQEQRLTLWTQAFPPKTKTSVTIDWTVLSQIELSGGAIEAIAYDALVRMMADGATTLKMEHLVAALHWQKLSDSTIQDFVDGCKLARKRTLAKQAKAKSSKTKQTVKSTKSKSAPKSTAKKPANKRARRSKTSKAGVDDASLSDPLVPDETTASADADEANAEILAAESQATSPADSTVQTPTS